MRFGSGFVRKTRGSAGSPPAPDRGGLVPLVLVRGTAALIAVLLGALVWEGFPWILAPLLLASTAAVLPSIGLVAVSLLLLVVSYAVNIPPGPVLLVFVAGLHAVFVLYLLLAPLPLHGWISRGALRELAVSYLRIQALAQPVAVVSLLVGGASASLPLVLAGVGALCAWLLWLVLSPRRKDRKP